MELDEFEILDRRPCHPGQGYSLSCRLSWIGGVCVEMAPASCGQHHRSGTDPLQPASIKNLHTAASPVLHPELADANTTSVQQSRSLLGMLPEHIDQGMAGSVLDMQHSVMAMGCFECCCQASIAVSIEIHPQREQSVDAFRCLVHKQTDGITVTEACARLDGVPGMAFTVVFAAYHGGDPALRPSAR